MIGDCLLKFDFDGFGFGFSIGLFGLLPMFWCLVFVHVVCGMFARRCLFLF